MEIDHQSYATAAEVMSSAKALQRTDSDVPT